MTDKQLILLDPSMAARMFGCARNPVSERMPVSEVNDRSGIELLILSVLRLYATLERKSFPGACGGGYQHHLPENGAFRLAWRQPGKALIGLIEAKTGAAQPSQA